MKKLIRHRKFENNKYPRVYSSELIPVMYAVEKFDFGSKPFYEIRVGGIVGGCGSNGSTETINEAEKILIEVHKRDLKRYLKGWI